MKAQKNPNTHQHQYLDDLIKAQASMKCEARFEATCRKCKASASFDGYGKSEDDALLEILENLETFGWTLEDGILFCDLCSMEERWIGPVTPSKRTRRPRGAKS